MLSNRAIIASVVVTFAVAVGAQGQTRPAETLPEDTGTSVNWRLRAGFSNQFETDIDDGGEFELMRIQGGIGATIDFDPKLKLTVGFGYERDEYDFSGATGFGGANPWDDVDSFRVSARFRYIVDQQWAVFFGPILGTSAEDGASTSNSFTGGGVVGVNYRANEDFSIGVGFGAISKIDDDTAFFPFFTFNWQAKEGLVVRSGRFDLGSSGGQGLEAAWQMNNNWELSLGAQYQTRRFRLDDQGVAPDGVGQETAIPFYVRSRWTFGPSFSAYVFGGVVLGGELLLEDSEGLRVNEQDFDPAPVIGAGLTYRF